MTPNRLRECLKILGCSQRGLARMLERQDGAVRQWARGTVQIPADVAAWVEPLALIRERNPPPRRPPMVAHSN